MKLYLVYYIAHILVGSLPMADEHACKMSLPLVYVEAIRAINQIPANKRKYGVKDFYARCEYWDREPVILKK